MLKQLEDNEYMNTSHSNAGGYNKEKQKYVFIFSDGTIKETSDFEEHYQMATSAGISFSRLDILKSMFGKEKAISVYIDTYGNDLFIEDPRKPLIKEEK